MQKNQKIILNILIIVFIAVLAFLAFVYWNQQKEKQNILTMAQEQKDTEKDGVEIQEYNLWKFDLVRPAFAQIKKDENQVRPSVPFYEISADELENLQSFIKEENIDFSEEQIRALEGDGFFLAENNIINDQSSWGNKDDFVDAYNIFDGNSNQYYRQPNNAIFITSDLALHLYHILIDRSFQRMEETRFQPMLFAMTKVLFIDSINKYNTATDSRLKDSYKRLSAYYLVPLVVLDAGTNSADVDLKPEDFENFAEFLDAQDRQKIAASGEKLIFSLPEKKYADMDLGEDIYELAKSELELIQASKGMEKSSIFSPLRPDFINDYSQFKPRSHYTKNDIMERFIAKAKSDLPAPRIVSEALAVYDDGGQRDKLLADIKQFRFMGQRFTPDAYIINNLTQGVGAPDPETGQLLPTMPTALMPLHIIAPENKAVKNYLDEWINNPLRIEKQGRESEKIIAKKTKKLIAEFAGYPADAWSQNIYWSWLDCFRSLLSGYGAGYPVFMQNDSWMKKNISTVLGSFTELKHDTLLYAKQSYAELGGGGDNPDKLPPVVKGYVEPDIDFWNKIIALAEVTKNGLEKRDIFPQEFKYKYESFIDSAEFFREITEKELENKKIRDEDFEKLRTINIVLSRIVEPINGQELTQKEKRAGIIADIHTDVVHQEILYEATGKPFIIYVAIQDVNGTRLTRGLVFNHYEFTDKLDERLADEDWQALVYEKKDMMPVSDKWSQELIK